MHIQLPTVGLIIIKERKLLLALSKNKACFYLPGGKIDQNESKEEALCREIAEELQVEVEKTDLQYYTHITAPAFGEKAGVIMEQECYFVNKEIAPHPSAEIAELQYFSLPEYLNENSVAPGVVMILEKLKSDNHID